MQSTSSDKQYKGVFRSLVRIWKEEGFKGYMRGNGINCVRIIPYSAVQFTTYEQLKKVRSSFAFASIPSDVCERGGAGPVCTRNDDC